MNLPPRSPRLLAALAPLALLLLAPAEARADRNFATDDNAPSGVEFGLRSGYNLALGAAAKGVSMSDVTTNQLMPVWLDVAYRIDENTSVGLYGSFGTGQTGNVYVSGSALDVRFGVDGWYHFLWESTFDPWVGIGVGYEFLSLSNTNAAGDSITFRGFELLNVQAGLDVHTNKWFSVGPYVAASFNMYTNAAATFNEGSQSASGSASIDGKGFHSWVTAGLRVNFGVYY